MPLVKGKHTGRNLVSGRATLLALEHRKGRFFGLAVWLVVTLPRAPAASADGRSGVVRWDGRGDTATSASD